MKRDPAQEREWLRQDDLVYGGLIAIGVYMVQPFLTAASLDLSARICVVAFSAAIPLLAALVMINRQEAFRGPGHRVGLSRPGAYVGELVTTSSGGRRPDGRLPPGSTGRRRSRAG
jgi:hypothetical protein